MAMDCSAFERVLFTWMDGELDAGGTAAAEDHVNACTACAGRVEAERAFEDRVRGVLLAEAGAFDVGPMVARARAGGTAGPRPPAPVLRLLGPLVAVAASLLLLVGGGWFFCIGPFECAYLQAVEKATHQAPATQPLPGDVLAAVNPLPDLSGVTAAPPQCVLLDLPGDDRRAVRCAYETDHGRIYVLYRASRGHTPDARRAFEHDGETWWRGDENGSGVVMFLDRATGVLYSVIGRAGEVSEEALLSVAEQIHATR